MKYESFLDGLDGLKDDPDLFFPIFYLNNKGGVRMMMGVQKRWVTMMATIV